MSSGSRAMARPKSSAELRGWSSPSSSRAVSLLPCDLTGRQQAICPSRRRVQSKGKAPASGVDPESVSNDGIPA